MEIKTVSNPWITRAESVRRSDRFIVACTGQSASIFDKDLNMIKQFRGLSYVYESRISPDESKIALISNCNWFHVVDTETFSITRMRMKGISGGDLDGKGCWSYDGKRLYLIPYDAETDNSVVRIYDAFDWSYTDTLRDRYFLTAIRPLKKPDTYLLIGYDRADGVAGSYKLIRCDGGDFTVFDLEFEDGLFPVIDDARLDEKEERIILHTDMFSYDYECGLTGGKLSRIPVSSEVTSRELQSASGEYFIKTDEHGITVTPKGELAEYAKMNIRYGVLDIAEIGRDIFLVSTKMGLRLIEVVP